jgi:hypothetical protein
MIKDLSAKLVAAVTEINQKSRQSFAAEQQEIATKKAVSAKMHTFMPKQPAPKADPAAVSKAAKMAEGAEGSIPKTPREKELAAKHGNKSRITMGDVLKARGVKREEVEQANEATMGHAGKVTMKHVMNSNASPQVKAAIKKAAPDIKSYGDRAAALNAAGIKREEVEQASEEHMGFKKLAAKTSPALAAWIGREKYGKDKFQKMAAAGKKHQAEETVAEAKREKEESAAHEKAEKKPAWPSATGPSKVMDKEKSAFNSKQISTGTVYSRKYEEVVVESKPDELSTRPGMFRSKADMDNRMTKEGQPTSGEKRIQKYLKHTMQRTQKQGGLSGPKGNLPEEVETLDELSKSTLGSYAKKATRDAVISRKIGADFEHQGNRAKSPGMKTASNVLSQKYKAKSWKRRDGADKAIDRLTKEDVESVGVKHDQFGAGKTLPQFAEDLSWIDVMFDEGIKRVYVEDLELMEEKAVHPDAIHVSDAGGGKYKVHAVGSNFSHGVKVGEHLNDTHLDDFSEMGGKVKMVKPPKKD